MIDPSHTASSQIQQTVTNPFQKRNDGQQQVRNDGQQTGHNQIQKTAGTDNNEGLKNTQVQSVSKSDEDSAPRYSSNARGSLLDITV